MKTAKITSTKASHLCSIATKGGPRTISRVEVEQAMSQGVESLQDLLQKKVAVVLIDQIETKDSEEDDPDETNQEHENDEHCKQIKQTFYLSRIKSIK